MQPLPTNPVEYEGKPKAREMSLVEEATEQPDKSFQDGHDAVLQSKVIFGGGGDIQPIHYIQAISALRKAQLCIQDLQTLLQAAHPNLDPLEREELIVDLRHMGTEIKDFISRLDNYDLANQRQLERNRKDTATRLSKVLEHLDDLGRHIHNKGIF